MGNFISLYKIMGTVKERIDSCINEWKRRLIDLTRRNRLIYFVPKRSSSLQIAEPTPSEVFNRFVIEEKPLRCFIPEEDDESNETPIQSDFLLGDLEEQPKSKGKRSRRSDEIICKVQETKVLRSVLRNLERRSRSDFEERGVRILHLAFGILEWQEVEQSELIRSPLLLVPVEIKRKSVLDPYEIWPTDEEIVINPALEVRLRNDFRIDLPAIPEDWEEIDLTNYLQKIIQKVGRRIMKAVNASIRILLKEGKLKKFNKFLWPSKDDFSLMVRQPIPEEKDSCRTIKFVALEEIELAVRNLIRSAFSISEDDGVKQVARIFGFYHTGANIHDRIKEIMKQMISRGDLILKGDRLSLP